MPLNNALAANDDRAAFESRWVRFNGLRVFGTILAFGLAIAALIV